MSNLISQLPTVHESSPEPQASLHSAMISIWLYPRTTLVGLACGHAWSWVVPIGLALLVFYARLFTLALLHDPSVKLSLLQGVVGILIGWPLCAAMLYTLGKLTGGRPGFMPILVMCAWTTLPLTLRNVVQVIYMWASGRLLHYPGLSGLFVDMDATHSPIRVGHLLLGRLDLYTLWHLCLLVLVVSIGAQISSWKAAPVVALYTVLTLLFSALVILI